MNNSAQTSGSVRKQECTVQSLYLSWAAFAIVYLVGLVFSAYKAHWIGLLWWLVLLPCARWASLKLSRQMSKWKVYGSVDDKLPASVEKTGVEVTYYSLLGCPFCPIVKQRLEALQKEMDFMLTKIDLTLKPQLAASRGIQTVPVVEVGKERLMGNATTEQLAKLIAGARACAPSEAS